MAGHESDPSKELRLADGASVPESVLRSSMMSIQAALEQFGALSAIDLSELARGHQLQAQPFGDTRSLFVGLGLASEREDGGLLMHDLTADVVRNSVHVNPQDPFDFRFTDPQMPFEGFESR